MITRNCLVSMLSFLTLFGCASRQLTPEEAASARAQQITSMSREYVGKSPKDILLAADRVFRLADSDYSCVHSENGLFAKRQVIMYYIFTSAVGDNTWELSIKNDGNKSRVSAVSNYNITTTPGGAHSDTVLNRELYDLFFSRLDYLLGTSGEWVSCAQAKQRFCLGSPTCVFDNLCVNADDKRPD